MEIFSGLAKGVTINVIISVILLITGIIHSVSHQSPKISFLLMLLVTIGFWQFCYLIPLSYMYNDESVGILASSIVGIVVTIYNRKIFKIKNRIEVESFTQSNTKFENLPQEVKREIIDLQKNNVKSFSATNKDIRISYYTTTMDDGFWTLATEGFRHHFLIEDQHYTLQANKGKPFILHEQHIYYPKNLNLSLYGMNLNPEEEFFRISLKN